MKERIFHTIASVAKISYYPIENSEKYTGMFNSKVDFGLIRFSLAKKPDYTKK